MAGFGVEFEEIVNKWDELIANFRPAIVTVIGKVVNDAYGVAQQNVPFDEGHLKSSGIIQGGDLSWEIYYSMFYAGYVHEGTSKMKAQPWLRNSIEQQIPSMEAAFKQLESLVI